MGRSFRIGFSIPKKNGRCLGGPQIKNKLNFSLSAHVLQRKPIRQPAQNKAVILYANKRVKYDLGFQSPLSWAI
jgi:hypothetical protein